METTAGGESRPRSRDIRCASYITVDDDDAANCSCRSSSSSSEAVAAEHHIRPRVSSQHSHDDTNALNTCRHLVSFSSDSSDVDDLVTDDVIVDSDAALCSYSEANRGQRLGGIAGPCWPSRRSHERQLEASTSGEQRVQWCQLYPCSCVCEQQHKSLAAERIQHSNSHQQRDGVGASGIVVTCYSNDQLGIRKTTAKSRRLGVVKTTIESTSLGLVETTVKLDDCPLVRTILDCRDLDLTETRLYNKELGVLKTTLHSGQDGLIKSSVHENLSNEIDNIASTCQNAAHNIENKNVWRDGLVHEGRQRSRCTTKPELEQRRRADRVENVVGVVTRDCRCNQTGRRLTSVCREHRFSDDNERRNISRRIRQKYSSLPVAVAQCGPLGYRQHQNDLHAITNRQVLEDHSLTSAPLLPSYGWDTSRVQSGDVSSSTSSSVSGDEMLIIDSLSDDDVIIDEDADEGNKLTADVDCVLTTAASISDDVSDTTIQADFDFSEQDLCETAQDFFEDDKNKEDAQLLQQQQQQLQHAATGQEVSVDELENSEATQLIDSKLNYRSKSDVIAVEVSEVADESGQRVLVKPCHVLLERLGTDSISHLQQSARSDTVATTVAISQEQNNSVHVTDIELACENTQTAAFTCDESMYNSVSQEEKKPAKWQNEVEVSPDAAAADSAHDNNVTQLYLNDYKASDAVCSQETSCNEVKGGIQVFESLSGYSCNRIQRILGVVKRCRRKTGKLQCPSEVFKANTRTRNKTVNAIKGDGNNPTYNNEVPLHDAFAHEVVGVTVSEQNIAPRGKPGRHCILSQACNVRTQQNLQGEVRNKCNLTPRIEAFKSPAKRKVRQAFTHLSKLSYNAENPKKKHRRAEGFWNLTKQKRSLKQKNFPKKSFNLPKETDKQPSECCHLNSSENTEIANSVLQQKPQKRARQFTRKCQTTKPKTVTKKKTKSKGAKKAENITWKIASLVAETGQDSKDVDNEGTSEILLRSSVSKHEYDEISHQESDHSIYQPDENDGDSEELGAQRDPIIVRFRRYPPASVSSSRQHNDIMRQVVAEIRRVHRRLDFVLLQRRRRRQSITSLARSCTGASAAAAVRCDPRSITAADNVSDPLATDTNSDDKVSDNSSIEPLETVTRMPGAVAWPVQVLLKSRSPYRDANDTDAVELVLCAAEQRPLQVDRVLACLASSASFILFTPALLTSPTQLLLMEAQLAGDVTRISTSALAPPLVKKKKVQRRAIDRSPSVSEQKLLVSECTDAVAASRDEQEMTELRPITGDKDRSTPAQASDVTRNRSTFGTNSRPLADEISFQLYGTKGAECRIDNHPASIESPGFAEHLQIYATSGGQCEIQTSSVIDSTSQVSVDANETSAGVDCDRSKAPNQRPKSVGAGKKRGELTPHRPGWLTPHLSQLNHDWQTSVNCIQRPPTMNLMSRHYPLYYQASPAGQSAGQSRSCVTPRDPGLSRVLPTLSLFDTELDLSECELSSHCADDNVDVDDLTNVPNYQYSGGTQQGPWSRQEMINPPLLKPEPRHPYDVIMPPHVQSRDYGVYQNHFYPTWGSVNSAGGSYRQHRPRSRPCTWWPMDSDQPAPANYAWSPYQHSHYRYHHHHHHPYQR